MMENKYMNKLKEDDETNIFYNIETLNINKWAIITKAIFYFDWIKFKYSY